MSFFDDELRKLQQIKAQNDALEQAQLAQQSYNDQMAQAQNALNMAQSAPTNPLESVLSGIGNSIKNVGTGLMDLFGTGGAAVGDAIESIRTGKATTKNQDDYRKWLYQTDSVKDAATKGLGTGLDAAATLTDFVPGLGSGAKVALNIGQGALSGVANPLIEKGSQATLEDAMKGALIGSASAGVGQAVGGKLAGKTAGNSTLSKAINSNIGKAAITGATSGATGGALASALNGGDLGQVLSGAAQGAGGGALGGATMAGAMGLAGAGLEKLNNKLNGAPDIDTQTKLNTIASDADIEGERATGWGDKNMTDAAKKRNALQKFGDTLQDTGQKTQDQSVIGKLKGNLADEVSAKNSVQRLRDLGFEPSDYEQAANLSEVANKWYDDQVKASKVKLDMPDTYKLADEAAYYRQLSADQADKLKMDITKRLDAVRATGGGLSTFDAAGLEKVARGLGQDAERMTTTNYGGSKKRISNLSADAEAYANALNDVKAALRAKVDDMTDYNPDTLRSVLKDAGATQKQIDYLTDAKSMAAVKRNTSLLEDARNMSRQIKSSPLKRGANSDASTNFTTQVANASGVSGLLNMAAEPFGKAIGKAEKGVGKFISKAGDVVSGKNINLSGKAQSLADALNNTTITNASYAGLLPTFGEAMTSQLARQAGLGAANAQENQANLQNAQQEAQNIQNDYNNAMTQAQTAYNNAQAMAVPETNANTARLEQITRAMDLALAAGDLDSYSQLASLYQTAYKIYAPAETATGGASSLNATQQNNLAKLESAGSAIDQLEQLYNQAGGGQGRLGGKLAEIGANLGMNSAASSYNSAARGLINQIAAAVGKTDSLNTEGEVQRALDLVPKITDTPEEAQVKLQSLRNMLNANKQTYQNIYGVSQ